MQLRPFLLSALILFQAFALRADELADKGREILDKNQRAVVTVRVVLKMNYSMPGMSSEGTEYPQDVTGTLVDSSGLAVLALSSCEPDDMMENVMAGFSDGSDDAQFKIDTELTDVKLLLEDGTEVAADIVLRDRDLDLAFIRPKAKPAGPMPAIDLSKAGKAQVLDPVITLNRLGEVAGRAYAASVERINAVVRKPRFFYVPDRALTETSLGSPVFTPDGRILGVIVMRSIKQKSGGLGLLSAGIEGMTAIILPAEEILKASRQALETNKETEPPPASKEVKGRPEKT